MLELSDKDAIAIFLLGLAPLLSFDPRDFDPDFKVVFSDGFCELFNISLNEALEFSCVLFLGS